jgi:hypothetical protein
MNIKDLYDKLDKVFVEHTTHVWKNSWPHEGDRESEEFTLQKKVEWNNLFLLTFKHNSLRLEDTNHFLVEVGRVFNGLRIDIKSQLISDQHIYYYVGNELEWEDHQNFIVDLCKSYYDSIINIKNIISIIPKIDNINNPSFIKNYSRERKLKELGL